MNKFEIQLKDEIIEKIKEHFNIDKITNETIVYIIEEIISTYYI